MPSSSLPLAQDCWFPDVPVSLLALALLPGTPGWQAPPLRPGLPGRREPGVGEGERCAGSRGHGSLCSQMPPLQAPLQLQGWGSQVPLLLPPGPCGRERRCKREAGVACTASLLPLGSLGLQVCLIRQGIQGFGPPLLHFPGFCLFHVFSPPTA